MQLFIHVVLPQDFPPSSGSLPPFSTCVILHLLTPSAAAVCPCHSSSVHLLLCVLSRKRGKRWEIHIFSRLDSLVFTNGWSLSPGVHSDFLKSEWVFAGNFSIRCGIEKFACFFNEELMWTSRKACKIRIVPLIYFMTTFCFFLCNCIWIEPLRCFEICYNLANYRQTHHVF